MNIEAVHRAYTSRREDGGELLHFARRRTNEDDVCINAVQTIIVVKNTYQLHIRSRFYGFFGCFADVAVT